MVATAIKSKQSVCIFIKNKPRNGRRRDQNKANRLEFHPKQTQFTSPKRSFHVSAHKLSHQLSSETVATATVLK
jgi:hypothetical protein